MEASLGGMTTKFDFVRRKMESILQLLDYYVPQQNANNRPVSEVVRESEAWDARFQTAIKRLRELIHLDNAVSFNKWLIHLFLFQCSEAFRAHGRSALFNILFQS